MRWRRSASEKSRPFSGILTAPLSFCPVGITPIECSCPGMQSIRLIVRVHAGNIHKYLNVSEALGYTRSLLMMKHFFASELEIFLLFFLFFFYYYVCTHVRSCDNLLRWMQRLIVCIIYLHILCFVIHCLDVSEELRRGQKLDYYWCEQPVIYFQQ